MLHVNTDFLYLSKTTLTQMIAILILFYHNDALMLLMFDSFKGVVCLTPGRPPSRESFELFWVDTCLTLLMESFDYPWSHFKMTLECKECKLTPQKCRFTLQILSHFDCSLASKRHFDQTLELK